MQTAPASFSIYPRSQIPTGAPQDPELGALPPYVASGDTPPPYDRPLLAGRRERCRSYASVDDASADERSALTRRAPLLRPPMQELRDAGQLALRCGTLCGSLGAVAGCMGNAIVAGTAPEMFHPGLATAHAALGATAVGVGVILGNYGEQRLFGAKQFSQGRALASMVAGVATGGGSGALIFHFLRGPDALSAQASLASSAVGMLFALVPLIIGIDMLFESSVFCEAPRAL